MKNIKIGNCTLIFGDAIQIMKDMILAGEYADMICTDPPYLLTSGGTPDGGLHERLGGGDSYDNSGQIVPCDIDWSDFMPALYGCLRQGHAYVMANNRNVQAMLNAAESAGFGFHNLLVWDKITATPNRWYMKNLEFIGFFYKENAFNINDCSAKQLIKCPQIDESAHPTEKPVPLMQHYIENSTQPGQVVFDPFMGSGTTGVAAVKSGRSFIGIEKNEAFFKMAVRRVTEETENFQPGLFKS